MPKVCGDGIASPDEECDDTDLKGADCTLFGFSAAPGVTCTADCKLDIGGCAATCDGALLEEGEECDGANLGNHDCTDFGFTKPAGAVCNATCTGIEIGSCKATCDGEALEPGEACDGADLGGMTCVDFGFDKPVGLACGADCEPDPSGCAPTCDGAKLEPGEACDGPFLGGKTCQDFGFVGAAGLACGAGCTFDVSGCAAACGNGVVEPGEACDGSAPKGAVCSAGCSLIYTTVINEVWYDPPGTDSTSGLCFIEIKGDPGLDLTGYSLRFIDGDSGAEYTPALNLNGQTIGSGGYFVVVQNMAALAALPAGANGLSNGTKADMQNGPESLQIVKGAEVVDALGYGTFAANFAGEGAPAQDPANSAQTLCRLPNGTDTGNNASDFQLCTPTPGSANLP